MKKHPILTVLIILVVTALLLGAAMFVFLKLFEPSSNLSFTEKIGVISIDGAISDSRTITSQLVKFRKNKKIKAIILRINSPGGSVGASQSIYREIQKTIQTKKVIASMGSVAASGGYYVAAAANKIVANPGTITGSIGVIMEFVRLKDLLKKIGINFEILKSGEFKDIGSPLRGLTERERKLLDALIEDIQKQFVKAIATGRNLTVEEVEKIADGRIFSGARAKELGLVDMLGNFHDAVDLARNMVGIKGEVTLVYPEKTKLELWKLLIKTSASSIAQLLQNTKTQIEYRWNGFDSM